MDLGNPHGCPLGTGDGAEARRGPRDRVLAAGRPP